MVIQLVSSVPAFGVQGRTPPDGIVGLAPVLELPNRPTKETRSLPSAATKSDVEELQRL